MQIDPALRMLYSSGMASSLGAMKWKVGWLHWLSSRQMHPTTRRRGFATCVSFMKSQCMSLASKMY